MTATVTTSTVTWRAMCATTDLPKGRSRTLHLDGVAVALFRTCDGEFYALADHDPFGEPGRQDGVISAGRLGYRRDVPVVESAGSGRRFELAGGTCVETAGAITPFPVRVTGGAVEIAVPAAAAA